MTTGDGDLAAVFDLLSDETRLAIVRALAERRFEHPDRADVPPDRAGLSFSELRTRVGARDAGRFNYHLGKLRGALVEKTPDGYRLTDRGVTVGGLLLDRTPLAAEPA
jgi:DNA-binding transcriptional ArsR family regulator